MIDQLISDAQLDQLDCDQDEFDAIMLFARVQTQWLRNDMSGLRTGLNMAGVISIADILEIKLTADVLQCLQVMEIEVITEGLNRSNHG